MATILIANPSEEVQKRFTETLEPEGYALVLCADGESVRREIAQATVSLRSRSSRA